MDGWNVQRSPSGHIDSAKMVLQKLNIVNDHIADDKEDFDLNFFPNSLTRQNTSSQIDASSSSSVSLNRVSTRNSIVDSFWGRKSSTAPVSNNDGGGGGSLFPALSRTNTWRSDRADSVVGGAPIEEEGTCTRTKLDPLLWILY